MPTLQDFLGIVFLKMNQQELAGSKSTASSWWRIKGSTDLKDAWRLISQPLLQDSLIRVTVHPLQDSLIRVIAMFKACSRRSQCGCIDSRHTPLQTDWTAEQRTGTRLLRNLLLNLLGSRGAYFTLARL